MLIIISLRKTKTSYQSTINAFFLYYLCEIAQKACRGLFEGKNKFRGGKKRPAFYSGPLMLYSVFLHCVAGYLSAVAVGFQFRNFSDTPVISIGASSVENTSAGQIDRCRHFAG